MRDFKEELQRRVEDGDKDLIIKYVKGTPNNKTAVQKLIELDVPNM